MVTNRLGHCSLWRARIISPLAVALFVLRCAFPRPAERPEATRDTSLVCLSPVFRLLLEAITQDLLNRHMITPFDPTLNQGLPGVFVKATLLLLRSCCT